MSALIKEFESKFLDYLEGTLPEKEQRDFEKQLATHPELQASFEEYKGLIELEQDLAQIVADKNLPKLDKDFNRRVMESISSNVLTERTKQKTGWYKSFFGLSPFSRYAAVSAAMALLVIGVWKEQLVVVPVSETATQKFEQSAPVAAIDQQEKKSVITDLSKETYKNLIDTVDRSKSKNMPAIEAVTEDHKKIKERQQDFEKTTSAIFSKIIERKKDANAPTVPTTPSAKGQAVAGSKPEFFAGKGFSREQYESSAYERGGFDDGRSDYYHPNISTQYSTSETYSTWEENPRVLTSNEAMSTFGMDVDTGSYTNARRFIQAGSFPPANSVRAEEFINYFDYGFPAAQESNKPFVMSYEIAPNPLDPQRHLLKLGVKTRISEQNTQPWNLVFLVDVSGSMSESNKLPLVQKALKVLVDNMRPQDSVAIVTYAGNAGLVLDATKGSERSQILNAIDTLTPGGGTYGSAGIQLAYDVAQRGFKKGAVNRVVLATDGDFNVGISDDTGLIRLIEEKRKSGVTLTTIGVGTGNLQEGKMEQLANKGNGNYFYLDTFQEARKVMETDLVKNMEVVAKDAKVQIEFNPEHVKEYRLIGYDNRRLNKEDFNNDAIDAGEVGSGHTVTALYEIVLTNSPLAKNLSTEYRYKTQEASEDKKVETPKALSTEIAFLKIRYKEPEGSASKLIEYPLAASEIKSSPEAASLDFRFAAAVASFAQLLRESKYKGNYTYKDVLKIAEQARGEDTLGYRREFIELVKSAKSIAR